MLQWEHSAILSIFIKLPFVVKIFVLSIFERQFYTGFTVFLILNQNICYEYMYLKDPSQWAGSFEHPIHMLQPMYKKII